MADDKKTEEEPQAHTNASTGEVIHTTRPGDDAIPKMAIKVETGPFDILPHHHNFLCMLVPCELIIKTPIETKKIKISRALMHVKAEKVTVFVDV
jgi:hypothetical protein